MEGMPIRFYCYRYQDYWEAELPVGWIVIREGNHLLFESQSPRGLVFTLSTTSKTDWETSYQGTEENRQKVLAEYRLLGEGTEKRKPTLIHESLNEDFLIRFRFKSWRFKGPNFYIMIIQNTQVDRIDLGIDAIVDRFVNTLRVVKV